MISVIVCSRCKNLESKLFHNIKNTVDQAFEFIVINNTTNEYTLPEAYNIGIERSKGELLCFIHEDVVFHSFGWGNVLINIFKNLPEIGLLGIAGSTVKTRMPSAWWDCPSEYHVINLIQHFDSGIVAERNTGFQNGSEVEVTVIDGVFMVMSKHRLAKFNTDIGGFHNYDLGISLENHLLDNKIFVTNQIKLEHFSNGIIDKNWLYSTLNFHKIYNQSLPLFSIGKDKMREYYPLEFINGAIFIDKLLNANMKKEAIYLWFKLFLLKPAAHYHYKFFKKILIAQKEKLE